MLNSFTKGLKFLLLCFSCILPLKSEGQINSWNYTQYTTKDGLPSDVIHRVTQDKDGFIWIATESGLCRFDGDEFVKVLHNQKDTSSMPTDFVYNVTLAPNGQLLASTSNGLYVMNTKTNKGYTIHSRISAEQESLDDNFRDVYINSKLRRIFVLTSTAMLVFDYKMNKLLTVAYPFPPSYKNTALSITNYSPVFLDNGDALFADNFTQEWGLFKYEAKKFIPFKSDKSHRYAAIAELNQVDCFSKDSLGNLWFHRSGKDTLYCYIPQKELVAYALKGEAKNIGWTGRICFPNSKTMTWAYVDRAKTILYELPYSYLLTHKGCTIQVDKPSGFSASINSHFTDNVGNWWIGSINGLYLVKSNRKTLEKIQLPVPFKFESEWQYVTDIKPVDTDHILITTFLEHCFLYNVHKNSIQSYLDSVGYQNAGEYALHSIIPLDKERNIVYGNKGFMFQNHRLIYPPQLTNEFEKLFDQYALQRFFIDSKGNRWVSFEDYGLVCWNPTTKYLKLYQPKGDFCSDKFTSSAEDDQGNLWFLNFVQSKLWKFDAKKLCFDSIAILLPYKWNKRMVAGKKNMLYMVSSDGVLFYDTKNKTHRLFNMIDYLPSGVIMGLHAYQDYLFISTKNGLAIMNTQDFTIRTLNQTDGIVDGLVTKAYYEDSLNHFLYVGGKGNVYRIDLLSFFTSTDQPIVRMDNCEVNGQAIFLGTNELVLKHRQNNITFSVSSIDYSSGLNKNYFYRTILDGDTSQWINNKSKRFSFLNMSPGNYIIEIKSTNANNQWSVNTAKLSITILKPWFNRWWFYGLIALAIALSLYLIYLNRIKNLMRIEGIRNRLSRDLHDDIGSTLSSINILSRTAQRTAQQQGDLKTKETLEKINERSQRLLSTMSDIIWNINPAHDSIDDVVSRMREYATTILEANQIEYHFYFPQEEIKQQVSMAIKNSLYLIFKEAVNNLVKYSGATTVSLYLLMEDGHNRLVIEDNGKGFDKSTLKHLGGLNNMEFRANEIKGTLHITSVLNKGTKVELIFPHFN